MIVGFEVSSDFFTLGIITGMVYGALAAGLVLIYRSSRIVNFAHGEIGTVAAAFLSLAVVRWNAPYWVAFAGALALGAGVGAATQVIVIRRLRDAPVAVGVVATLGLGEVLLTMASTLNSSLDATTRFPLPANLPTFSIGALNVTEAYSAMLFATPVVVVALALFLRRGRLGRAMRASAADPGAAQMAGILPGRMAALAWAIGGALAAYTAVLVFPTLGVSSINAFGPTILLRALAAAVVARMVNLPVALLAGVVIGVVEQLLRANYSSANFVELFLFAVILVALLFQRSRSGRSEQKGSWAAVQAMAAVPESYRRLRSVRNVGRVVFALGFAVAVGVAFISSNATAVILATMVGFIVVGLSVTIITGLGGELSLGQFAIAGTGAIGAYVVSEHTDLLLLSLLAAGLVGAVASLAIGLPALRIHGLFLAVTTLGFALAASTWGFSQSWSFGDRPSNNLPTLFGYDLDTSIKYYLFSLAILAAALWFVRNVWRSGVGLRLRAVRDNDDAARAFTVPVMFVKLQGFVVAGFVAGVGGGLYARALSTLSVDTFPIESSIKAAVIAVLGGLGVFWSPIFGALFIFGLPRFVELDTAGIAASGVGWLILILFFPGGVAQWFERRRDALMDVLARRAGLDPETERAGAPAGQLSSTPISLSERGGAQRPAGDVALEVTGVSKSFGGVHALDGVDLHVMTGETVGLIGPNGAGKTTLFEIVSGFTKPDSGTVAFFGQDVSRESPEARGRRGLIRSFQDAALFPTFTVLEAVTLATERTVPTKFFASMIGTDRSSAKRAVADEIVSMMGLHEYRDTHIRALSTGTRRITEFACLVALEPSVLLLDEPSSGIAQRETEALGHALTRIKKELDLTLVIVEHDMPLIMGISDRIVAMAAGQVLIAGTPEEVRADERVIESYLGGDVVAIERSDFVRSSEPG